MTTVLFIGHSVDVDLDETELTEADILPLSDDEAAQVLAQLDPFAAPVHPVRVFEPLRQQCIE
jgi:hypothetical protein